MRRPFARRLTREWPLKLVSLVLALGVWLLLVPYEKVSSEKSLTIPLETRNVPAGLEIVERPPATVDITLRAANRLLDEIGPSALVARLDLDRASVPQQEYPLRTSMIAVPPGAEVIKISPSKVTIKLERTVAAALEVRATVQGKPAKGFHVEDVEVEPSSVAVQGPESRIRAKLAATTAPVDISGLAQPTVFEADIILPRPELRFVSLQTSARIAVRIVPDKAPARTASRRVS
ncbi:MAG TPA: CdaR family protein [Candidatus Aminicenantes bacterium]|nr:CdaR family protein [Candidatus Aminicenantes bacterium]HRY64603.1 CdaR family protein [Candidatus Aminicenantes bacterium]HRZ71516.1 CdaR family protein [Candidatus Aminicenantes bacterium]